MNIPTEKNEKLNQALEQVNKNTELQTLWEVVNVNAVKRLGMSDHGPVHVQIVANIALKLLRTLHKNDIQTCIEEDYELPYDNAEVVVFLASLMHDIGMTIERKGHEEMSLFLGNRLANEILTPIIEDVRVRTIMVSEILHAISAHRAGGKPRTLEAGIVRVADALDMAEGRSRIAFDAGEVNIHSVSAIAIKKIDINEGKDKPIHIKVHLENSAGIFQIDDLFNKKIKGSGLEEFLSLSVLNEGKTEKKIVKEYEIK